MAANKIVTADEAIALIRDGDTVAVSGFVGIGTPEELIEALERRFLRDAEPARFDAGLRRGAGRRQGARSQPAAHDGLVKRAIGGHWSLVPKLAALATHNRIEAYNLPLGIISHLYRDVAAHRAGTLSKVGLRTFVDPRQRGGKINARTTEDLVRVMEIDGEEWLFYKAFPINVALHSRHHRRRGRQHHDGARGADAGRLAPRWRRRIPTASSSRRSSASPRTARSIAREVVCPACWSTASWWPQPENHLQTYGTPTTPPSRARSGCRSTCIAPLPLDERKIIARRCAFELPLGGVVNLGIGMPEGVAAVANEERVLELPDPDRRAGRHRRHAARRAGLRRRGQHARR